MLNPKTICQFVGIFYGGGMGRVVFIVSLTHVSQFSYTTEVHREYVPVAGHGAWLAVLLT